MSLRRRFSWRTRPVRRAEALPFLSWLQDRGSLTARLQARAVFELRLLRQEVARPTFDEAVALGLRRKQVAWIREVALCCDGEPVVFAHTVLPYRPVGSMTRWLARLGTRSLGALLFSHPGFVRGPLRARRLDRRHVLFQPACRMLTPAGEESPTARMPAVLWARRSRFCFGRQNVLVTEVFSPTLARR